jgi:hypothetical protein
LAGVVRRVVDLVVRLAIEVANHLRGLFSRSDVTNTRRNADGILARHGTTSQPELEIQQLQAGHLTTPIGSLRVEVVKKTRSC